MSSSAPGPSEKSESVKDDGSLRNALDFLKVRIKKWHLTGPVILVGFVLLSFIVFATGPDNEPQIREEKSWPVSVMTANPSVLSPNLLVFGKAQTDQMASIKTSITAPVERVYHREGAVVQQGELLMQLEASELQLALDVAKAEYLNRSASLKSVVNEFNLAKKLTTHEKALNDIAQARLQRQLDLYKQSMVSNALVDEARRIASESSIKLERHLSMIADFPNRLARRQAELDESLARVEKAELDLSQTRIVAPFNGRILKTSVSEGDRVVAGLPLLEIAGSDELEIRAALPLTAGASLRRHLAAGANIYATGEIDGEKLDFQLERLSSSLKHGQSGVDAFFKLTEGRQPELGRVINLDMVMPLEPDVVPMPVQAVYEGNRIYRIRNQRLEGLPISIVGDYIDERGVQRVLVRAPTIARDDTLLTTQLPRAITGLLVDPIDADEMLKLQVMK